MPHKSESAERSQNLQNNLLDRMMCRRKPMRLPELARRDNPEEVKQALELLEARGVIQSRAAEDGTTVWSLL